MTQDRSRPEQLAHSWDANADAWTRLVRNGGIESRRVATDAAIIEAVTARAPRRTLDLGCGEGWLCRALAARGLHVVGADGSATLVQNARASGGGEFLHLSYDELAAQPTRAGARPYDAVVCNFSLLHERIEPLLRGIGVILAPGGALFIQTLHPWSARSGEPYHDGWRTESFAAMTEHFAESMPWFFRTLASWSEVLRRAGYLIAQLQEPVHPDTGEPLSLLIIAQR